MSARKLTIVGELINNAYARARTAFSNRDLKAYQQLASSQVGQGSGYLDINLDGTARIQVRQEEMLALLPDVITAVQAVTDKPLCFDNPAFDYHRIALQSYDRTKGGAPIINSIAASRDRLDDMISLVRDHDAMVVVMSSERFVPGGSAQCMTPQDAYETAKHFVDLLVTKAGRRLDQILIDPGLAPVGADTYGLVNLGLDAMRLISADPNLRGVHMIVGLSNFAWGTPKGVREQLECAYLTLGMEAGLDFAIANPEKSPAPLPVDHPMVVKLRDALQAGRPLEGETHETAGYRQAEAIMAICAEAAPAD